MYTTILKCFKMLPYRKQPRLSCWVFCIFLIVVLLFNSVPINDYSKNYQLYRGKTNVISGNWKNEQNLSCDSSDNDHTSGLSRL